MAAQDYGIFITAPNVDAVNGSPGVRTNQTLLNTSYALIKIDTQKSTGFQKILLLITNDPPEPVAPATHIYTVVYKFKHGYNYIPAHEHLMYVTTAPPTGGSQSYNNDWILLKATSVDTYAALYATADATWVYFVIDKYNDQATIPAPPGNLLTGINVQIGSHIFVDDVGV